MPPPPEPEAPRRRRRWVVFLIVGLLVLGGCGAAATYAGMRFMGSMSAPVDVANDLLDAARTGGDTAGHLCGDAAEVDPRLASSEGQRLTSVHVSNNRVASVGGTITLDGGERTGIDLELRRRDGEWCVQHLAF